jgi:hypothetical protein
VAIVGDLVGWALGRDWFWTVDTGSMNHGAVAFGAVRSCGHSCNHQKLMLELAIDLQIGSFYWAGEYAAHWLLGAKLIAGSLKGRFVHAVLQVFEVQKQIDHANQMTQFRA